jgi:predicted dehydrogenase
MFEHKPMIASVSISHPSRRSFLKTTSGSLLSLSALACAVPQKRRPFAPDEEVRVAVVGLNSRGRAHVNGFKNLPNVRVVALCDADSDVLAREVARFTEGGAQVDAVHDFRELLQRKDLHAVSLATPNHLHALQTVWACEAGLDVYVEKPVSHNFGEGELMVAAARKYGSIVQTGTQSRSSHAIRDAIAWLHAGNLGKIQLARGFCYKPRKSIGKVFGPQPIPSQIDHNLWTGPAPLVPLMRKKLHYDWHWDSTTGNGDLGNQGVHQVDLCRWALGANDMPLTTLSIGGRLGYDDDGDTPNTQILWAQYEEGPMLFEVRGLPRDAEAQKKDWAMGSYDGIRIGVIMECEKGTLRIPNYTSATAVDRDGNTIKEWKGANDHFANFVDAMRSRKSTDLAADIEEGHRSATPCHFGVISHSLGQPASTKAILKVTEVNPDLHDAAERMIVHLVDNKVDLDKTPLTLGMKLYGKNGSLPETIASDRRTQAWLYRAGRPPFTI